LLAIAFSLFFASEKVQTRVANSITQRLNNSFETEIEIGAAKIDLAGRIRLGAVLVKDHKQDTLFYLEELKLKLDELEGVLKGDYQFSSIFIDQPYLAVKTYPNESLTNLSQFIDKLKNTSKKAKPFLANIEVLVIEKARLSFVDLNTAKIFELEALNSTISRILNGIRR